MNSTSIVSPRTATPIANPVQRNTHLVYVQFTDGPAALNVITELHAVLRSSRSSYIVNCGLVVVYIVFKIR